MGIGSGASRTHRAGHAVLRGPLDVNGQGRHGTGVWMRKTRIRIPPRAYRPPNDPLPRPGTISGTPDKYSVFRVSVRSRSTPIACPALIREGARRVCRTPIPLGVATASCPPTKRRPRVSRARHATPDGRPDLSSLREGRGGVSPKDQAASDLTNRTEFLESRDPLRQGATIRLDLQRRNQSRKNEKKCAMGF